MTNKEFIDTLRVCGRWQIKENILEQRLNKIYNSDVNVSLILNWWVNQNVLDDSVALSLIYRILRIITIGDDIEHLEKCLINLLSSFESHVEYLVYKDMVFRLIHDLENTLDYEEVLDLIKRYKVYKVLKECIIRVNDEYILVQKNERLGEVERLRVTRGGTIEDNILMVIIKGDNIDTLKVNDKYNKESYIRKVIEDTSIDLVLTDYNINDKIFYRKP